uniref:Uncharacterized protein n=1 Tax=Litorilinea aerophila TaxID=1204385 RepID=A0A540VA10_9CHLR
MWTNPVTWPSRSRWSEFQSPLPFYLAAGRTLQRDVPAGALLPCDGVEEPGASTLWTLRMQPGYGSGPSGGEGGSGPWPVAQ